MKFAGRIELRKQPESLNGLVEDLIGFIHAQAPASKVRIHTAPTPENPLCNLDANLFKQAILNLMLNGIQADAGGGDLVVRTLAEKGTAILYISDTGVGIPAENMPHIFDAYFTTKKGGTKLGLPTTRRIIEEHDGHIVVESEPGRGTSFRVDLPLAT